MLIMKEMNKVFCLILFLGGGGGVVNIAINMANNIGCVKSS